MLINGKDLDNYSCSLIDRKITPTEVITYNEWLDGAIQPTFVRQQDGFKTIEVTLIMRAESELDAQYLISELTRDCKKCEINFDEDMDELFYDCILSETPSIERLIPSVFQITLSFQSGYACGKRVTLSKPDISSGEVSFKVKGTTAAPLIFKLTPISSTIVEVNVEGMTTQPCKLIDIPANYTLVVDGENNTVELVAADGTTKPAIDCYTECWELPKVYPGNNTITFDYVTGYNIEISYKPRYI